MKIFRAIIILFIALFFLGIGGWNCAKIFPDIVRVFETVSYGSGWLFGRMVFSYTFFILGFFFLRKLGFSLGKSLYMNSFVSFFVGIIGSFIAVLHGFQGGIITLSVAFPLGIIFAIFSSAAYAVDDDEGEGL